MLVYYRVKGGTYSDKQFRALSSEGKGRVQKYLEKAKKKKKKKARKKDQKDKRKLAKLSKAGKVTSSVDETDGKESLLAASLAGAEFSANGNESKKSKT